MKKMKRISALMMAMLLITAVLCSACGGGGSNGAYKVTVVDALGNPYTSGVVVKFMQNGQQAGMQVVGENGVAEKELPAGDYTVELQFTGSDVSYHYDKENLKLSSQQRELTVELAYELAEESQKITAQGDSCEAYPVNVGCTYVELNKESRSYFLFTPTEPGTYEFSLVGSDAAIGYYGAPHFVQENSAAEVVDNKFTASIRASMISTDGAGTTVMVIGVDAAEGNAVLAIERIGDPEWSVEDEPWTVYQMTTTPSPYTLPAGAKLTDMDLTAASDAYNLVLNEADGFYHLNTADGPLVLVRLGEVSGGSKYLDPIETILEHSGITRYFYDENDTFVKKEDYSECLLKYIENMDEASGVYPLTEDLKYIIQNRGEYVGWWDTESSSYLFVDENGEKVPGINADIAWLLYCCYIDG